jgi:hypothetical protein
MSEAAASMPGSKTSARLPDFIVLAPGRPGQWLLVVLPGYTGHHHDQRPVQSFRGIRMNEQAETDAAPRETLARIEEHVRCRLSGLLRHFQLVCRDNGLVLRGHAHTYYAKQLAQHAVMEASSLPIRANELEVP